jgi:hypothetical protein
LNALGVDAFSCGVHDPAPGDLLLDVDAIRETLDGGLLLPGDTLQEPFKEILEKIADIEGEFIAVAAEAEQEPEL